MTVLHLEVYFKNLVTGEEGMLIKEKVRVDDFLLFNSLIVSHA